MHNGDYHEVPLKECHAFTREGCKLCPDFAAEHADISTGGIGAFNDWTLTIVRTDAGREIMDGCSTDGWIEVAARRRRPRRDRAAAQAGQEAARPVARVRGHRRAPTRRRVEEARPVHRPRRAGKSGRRLIVAAPKGPDGRSPNPRPIPVRPRPPSPIGDDFVSVETLGGIVLLAAAVAALDLGQQSWPASYTDLGRRPHSRAGSCRITYDLRDWVNDGLMTVFFLVVGMEIKRELVEGELAIAERPCSR